MHWEIRKILGVTGIAVHVRIDDFATGVGSNGGVEFVAGVHCYGSERDWGLLPLRKFAFAGCDGTQNVYGISGSAGYGDFDIHRLA
jgi:hypothetical protein